ncbi:MAG: endolytic transglycosylase MltG [Clostridia bacterium]|nr:endolytic transglycosylase MltG [Clostridia bacterium]
MGRKGTVAIMGFGLTFLGIIIAAPVIIDVLSSTLKGYGWDWSLADIGKLLVGSMSAVAGFFILFLALSKKAVSWIAILGVFLFIMLVGSFFSYRQVVDSQNNKDKEVTINIDKQEAIIVDIPYNSNTVQIAEILEEKGVIKHPFIFKILSKINGYDNTYQAGTHTVSNNLNYDSIMRILSGKPESVKITIQEGLTYKQTVDLLVKKNLVNREEFDRIVKSDKSDYKFLKGIPERKNKLEGYLFPDTYEFPMQGNEKEIIKTMLDNFDTKFKDFYYKRAEDLGMSIDEVITLASIIEKESGDPEDRRIISGIFHKRLKSKNSSLKKLQSCATLQYIFLNNEGTTKPKISIKDTEIDDRYNTYKYAGLPPGPICSPGLDSIDAALNPDETEYWYFVARGDGSTEFTKSYNDHLKAMKKYGLLN